MATKSTATRVGKQGMVWQKGCGMAVCEERHAGRVLKLCHLDQGAVVSTQQKAKAAPNSVSTSTEAASQTEL